MIIRIAIFVLLLGAQAVTARTPLSVVRVMKMYDAANPEHVTIVSDSSAIRSDGAVVSLILDQATGRVDGRSILEVAPQQTTMIDDLAKTVTHIYRTKRELAMATKVAARCEDAFGFSGVKVSCTPVAEKRFGQALIKVTTELVRSDNLRVRRELLVAPSLNWFEIEWKSYQNDILGAEMHVTSLTVGEPDAALFTAPAGYKELPYAEYMATHSAVRGHPLDERTKSGYQQKEQRMAALKAAGE